MRTWLPVTLFLLAVSSCLVAPSVMAEDQASPEATAAAQRRELEEWQRKQAENKAEQEKIRQLLTEAQAKKASLANEIDYQNNQIKLTSLKIEETQNEIANLKVQIEELGAKIERLEKTLGELAQVTQGRITATYKAAASGLNPLFLIFSSQSTGDFITRYKYVRVLQRHDKKLLNQMQLTRDNYDGQRDLKKEKQTQAQELEARLEDQKRQLDNQKREKEQLIIVTQNDEKRYRERLETLIADEKAIEEALNDILARITKGLVSGQSVTKGQVIGRQGNTGNVFPRPWGDCPECGSHLHFMILTCGEWQCAVNPQEYLAKGELARPLATWQVTQGFGPASCTYCGYAFHNGIDLTDDSGAYGTTGHGAPVYAIADGEMYYGTDGAGGKYAIIKHADNFYSAYWHLQ